VLGFIISRFDLVDLRPGVTGVVAWYVQSVNKGTDNAVVVVLPGLPGDITVILMLGGVQAVSSVMFRNVLGAFRGVGGVVFARHVEPRIDMAKMNLNMVRTRGLVDYVASYVNDLPQDLGYLFLMSLLSAEETELVTRVFLLTLDASSLNQDVINPWHRYPRKGVSLERCKMLIYKCEKE
jgi:hypothetical protein